MPNSNQSNLHFNWPYGIQTQMPDYSGIQIPDKNEIASLTNDTVENLYNSLGYSPTSKNGKYYSAKDMYDLDQIYKSGKLEYMGQPMAYPFTKEPTNSDIVVQRQLYRQRDPEYKELYEKYGPFLDEYEKNETNNANRIDLLSAAALGIGSTTALTGGLLGGGALMNGLNFLTNAYCLGDAGNSATNLTTSYFNNGFNTSDEEKNYRKDNWKNLGTDALFLGSGALSKVGKFLKDSHAVVNTATNTVRGWTPSLTSKIIGTGLENAIPLYFGSSAVNDGVKLANTYTQANNYSSDALKELRKQYTNDLAWNTTFSIPGLYSATKKFNKPNLQVHFINKPNTKYNFNGNYEFPNLRLNNQQIQLPSVQNLLLNP